MTLQQEDGGIFPPSKTKTHDPAFSMIVRLENQLVAAKLKIVQQQKVIDALNVILQIQIEEMSALEPLRNLLPEVNEYNQDG